MTELLGLFLDVVQWLLMIGVAAVLALVVGALILELVLDHNDEPRWRRERRS